MDGQQFAQHLLNISNQAQDFINNDSPVIMGNIAVGFFKEAFQDEGFTDNAFQKWDEVKRRLNPNVKGAKATRSILTGDTGNLGRSIKQKNAANGQVTIYSDVTYAAAHNEGTNSAGRNRNVTIPKRQFIGDSQKLNQQVTDELRRKLDNIMK